MASSLRLVTVIGAALALGACSSPASSTPLSELEVLEPDAVLAEAESFFQEQVVSALPETATTPEDGGKCFFSGTDPVLAPVLYCGPVRHLGADVPAWHSVPLTVKAGREEILLSVNAEDGFFEVKDPPQALNRPDDVQAPELADLPEPDAPPFPDADFARLLTEDSLDTTASWESLDEPPVVNAPAATFRVTARAQLETLPAHLAEAEEQVSHYAPAEGQTVTAWKLEVLDSVVPGPPGSGWGGRDGARDASARLSVPSGSQRIPVEGADSSLWGSSDVFTVECENSVPCDTTTGRYVLLTSTPEGGSRLIVSTDGQDQILNLDDGSIETSVSSVADERSQLVSQLSTTWPRNDVTILTEEAAEEDGLGSLGSDITLTYAGQLDAAFLSPFHWEGGWAEPGRAWLTVPIENDPQSVTGYLDMEYDRQATYTLTTGEDVTEVADVGTFTFDVPADFTQGEFRYRPTGHAVYMDSPFAFEADEGLSIEIAFEE